MNHKTKKRIQEFTFVLPALIMFLIFVIVPFIQGFPMSFTKWDGMSPNKPFVGFSNYLRIFQDGNVCHSDPHFLRKLSHAHFPLRQHDIYIDPDCHSLPHFRTICCRPILSTPHPASSHTTYRSDGTAPPQAPRSPH